MRAYATMSEMEDYIKKGKDIFIKTLGGKTMTYKKFVENLDKAEERFHDFPHEKLGTKKGKQIVDDMCTYWSVEILILSTLFQNRPLSRESVEFMYNNYDKERALRYFDPKGYEVYMQEKEDKMKNNIADVPENNQPQPRREPYDNGNYIDLE